MVINYLFKILQFHIGYKFKISHKEFRGMGHEVDGRV